MVSELQKLQEVLPKLKAKDVQFASDLIYKGKKYGLSNNQMIWVNKLIDSATNPQPEPQKVELGGFEAVINLFQKAKQHLKYPKVVLHCEGKKVVLSLAGEKSKAPGSINVAGEGQYPNKVWYGRVSPQGVWEPSYSIKPNMLDALKVLLEKFGKHPARVAKQYGAMTGNCCFCSLPLSDKRSVAAGFGPVCAKHYGLEDEWKQAVKKMEAGESDTPLPGGEALQLQPGASMKVYLAPPGIPKELQGIEMKLGPISDKSVKDMGSPELTDGILESFELESNILPEEPKTNLQATKVFSLAEEPPHTKCFICGKFLDPYIAFAIIDGCDCCLKCAEGLQ